MLLHRICLSVGLGISFDVLMKRRGCPDDAESVFYGGLFFLDDRLFFCPPISSRFGKRDLSSLTTYLEDVSFPQKQAPIVY